MYISANVNARYLNIVCEFNMTVVLHVCRLVLLFTY